MAGLPPEGRPPVISNDFRAKALAQGDAFGAFPIIRQPHPLFSPAEGERMLATFKQHQV